MLNLSGLRKPEEPLNTAHPKDYPAHSPSLLHMTESSNFGRAEGRQRFLWGCLRGLGKPRHRQPCWRCKRGLEHRAKATHHIMRPQAGWDPKTDSRLLPAPPQVSRKIWSHMFGNSMRL